VLNAINFGLLSDGRYGGSPGGLTEPEANKLSVFNNYDINYTSDTELPPTTTLVLSNAVEGVKADKEKEFMYTLTLKDGAYNSDLTSIIYTGTGSIVDGSGAKQSTSTTLTLLDGKATVVLKHDESVTLADLPLGTNIQIVQTTFGWPYVTSFIDSNTSDIIERPIIVPGNPESAKPDTGPRILAENDPRTFAFTNEYDDTPPTGVGTGKGAGLPFVLLICGLWLIYKSASGLRRRGARCRF
jgi:hypothetical protein